MSKRKMRRRIIELERRVFALEAKVHGSIIPTAVAEDWLRELQRPNPYSSLVTKP